LVEAIIEIRLIVVSPLQFILQDFDGKWIYHSSFALRGWEGKMLGL
jgi:hypothetical protein